MNDCYDDENGNTVNTYDDPVDGILEWYRINGEVMIDEASFRLYLQEECKKLPEDARNNGISLRDAMEEIVKKFF